METLRKLWDFLKRLHRDKGGQAMTEAAIILPIFITTIAMTLELCVLATTKSVVNYAAYSACRAGIVHNADPQYMVTAASMAISPVTQSNIIPVKPPGFGTGSYDRYGAWDWDDGSTGSSTFMDASSIVRGGQRTGNFVTGTTVALLHFSIALSGVEYLILGFRNTNHLAQPVLQIAQGAEDFDINAIQAGLRKLDGLLLLPTLSMQPINRIQILQPFPTTSEEIVAETGGVNPLSWRTSDISLLSPDSSSLLTESGNTKQGVDFGAVLSGRNPNLILRVRVYHRHMLMFPFLRAVYDSVLDRRDVDDNEAEIAQIAGMFGMVEIAGNAAMRMQSNFTLGE